MSYFENLGEQFDSFITSIKKRNKIYLLPIISFFLSILFVLNGFTILILSIVFMINISFFAYMIRDCYSIRKENIIPLLFTSLSIFFSAIQMLSTLQALANMANLFK